MKKIRDREREREKGRQREKGLLCAEDKKKEEK